MEQVRKNSSGISKYLWVGEVFANANAWELVFDNAAFIDGSAQFKQDEENVKREAEREAAVMRHELSIAKPVPLLAILCVEMSLIKELKKFLLLNVFDVRPRSITARATWKYLFVVAVKAEMEVIVHLVTEGSEHEPIYRSQISAHTQFLQNF